MAVGMRMTGMGALTSRFDRTIKRAEKRIVDIRRQVAMQLVASLVENIPVWSGRDVRSIAVSDSPMGGNAGERHPDRGNTSKDGRWENHKREFGDTRNMAMGQEPMRASAEAVAMASAKSANYEMDSKVFITSDSYLWAEIDNASYREDARNNAVVSLIAIQAVRSKFGTVLK